MTFDLIKTTMSRAEVSWKVTLNKPVVEASSIHNIRPKMMHIRRTI